VLRAEGTWQRAKAYCLRKLMEMLRAEEEAAVGPVVRSLLSSVRKDY